MKTINLQIYSFNELSESVQNKIVENWRNDDFFPWADENNDSLISFCEIFDIKIREYDYSYRQYVSASFNMDSSILELSGLRLAKYIWNNHKQHLYKGRYYSKGRKSRHSKIQITPYDCTLTGYCMDNSLIMPLIEFMDKPDDRNFQDLLNDCLETWLNDCSADYDDWLSRERIIEDIEANDYVFFESGELATKYESLAAA
jgi:hypothetical protein